MLPQVETLQTHHPGIKRSHTPRTSPKPKACQPLAGGLADDAPGPGGPNSPPDPAGVTASGGFASQKAAGLSSVFQEEDQGLTATPSFGARLRITPSLEKRGKPRLLATAM